MSSFDWPKGRVETIDGVQVKAVPEDEPEFKRVYRTRLDDRASVTITARTSTILGRRNFDGTLDQPNGRWVIFDPERIADKILDPVLVPLIEAAVATIRALDKQFMGNGPAEYVDGRGVVWRRAP